MSHRLSDYLAQKAPKSIKHSWRTHAILLPARSMALRLFAVQRTRGSPARRITSVPEGRPRKPTESDDLRAAHAHDACAEMQPGS